MKNKLKTWLNIITICFCFAAIAVGVYAASQASLKVNGQIGFTAHNCKVSVNGYIYGHGATLTGGVYVNDPDGLPVPEPTAQDGSDRVMLSQSPVTIEGGVTPEAQCKLDLGKRYFTDMASETGKPADIYITIIVTNTSQYYKVKATIDTSTAATVFADGKIIATPADETTVVLDKTGVGATATLTYKLELQKTGDEYAELNVDTTQIALKMNFEKYKEPIYKYDEAKNYYYIEMGTNPYRNNEPLRWFAFAQKQDNDYEYIANSVEPTSGNTYYFISELVFKTEDTNTPDSGGLAFQNKYNKPQRAIDPSYVTGTSYAANDYAVSNVRKYLNGQDVYNSATLSNNVYSESGTKVNIDFYNITTSDFYKNYITARPLSELYRIGSVYPYNCGDEADNLWLVNDVDLDYIRNEYGEVAESTNYNQTTGKGVSFFCWYTRESYPSAMASIGGFLYQEISANRYDIVHSSVAVSNAYGIRPAFQITMP